MTNIPRELYDHVFDIATAMTRASEEEDWVAYNASFGELRALFESEQSTGRVHPALTETFADYTDEPERAIELYRLALADSQAFPGEHTYTKHLSLAERLIDSGRVAEGREHLELGRKEAEEAGDAFWIEESNRLTQTLVA